MDPVDSFGRLPSDSAQNEARQPSMEYMRIAGALKNVESSSQTVATTFSSFLWKDLFFYPLDFGWRNPEFGRPKRALSPIDRRGRRDGGATVVVVVTMTMMTDNGSDKAAAGAADTAGNRKQSGMGAENARIRFRTSRLMATE
ncbi:hypothetical protein I7I51_07154 [Histoplasma capsulatum]|uniref:Uncharacterized protein n=1 Tax=Ajellomyces capsulatus TaxID=5037 RepID=A0A8A1MQF7_AJECA|nr:hypothetical protein I7I51_07154 [Histoplasma capsulatum]